MQLQKEGQTWEAISFSFLEEGTSIHLQNSFLHFMIDWCKKLSCDLSDLMEVGEVRLMWVM